MIRFGDNTYINIFFKCSYLLLLITVVYTKLTYHPYNLKFTCFQSVNLVLKRLLLKMCMIDIFLTT